MEMEEKLKWLEMRISSSLRPRNEDIKNMMHNDENRLAVNEFINNEDAHRLFIFLRAPKEIIASLSPPANLTSKSVFFMKNNQGVKLTKDNMDDEVTYLDCGLAPMEQLDMLVREVYIPLMCTDNQMASAHGVSADKLLDILHRLMASLEVGQGHVQGEILLPLPSIEVLAEAAASVNRRSSVLHVLETTVIGWIKQIKGLLKHEPMAELEREAGPHPGPLDEIQLWAKRLDKLNSITDQLNSPIAVDILTNLDEASSAYSTSFTQVRKEIAKAISETEETLLFLSTMDPWFQELHDCLNPQRLVKLFAPLIHTLLLVWKESIYYHQPDNFHNLLRLISNEVVHRAEAMVGEDVLREPLESYTKLKEALRVCAAFRGTYLDYRDKSEELNEANVKEHAESLIQRPQGPNVLFSTKMYGSSAYQPKYGLKGGTAEEVEEALRQEELGQHSPWPPRNAPAFDLLNAFMERCNDVLELVQTTRHFRLLSDAAEVGGAGSASLDALVKEIHQRYTVAMSNFFKRVSNVLSTDGSQAFEDAFFTFRTVVKDLERKLADVLRQSFQQCPTIGSQLRLLEVFEGISGRELVQKHLRDKDVALVQLFTDELIKVRSMFHTEHKKPPLHSNMPPFVSRLLWIHALKDRVQIPMNKMKKVCPQLLDGDMGWQLRDAYTEAVTDFERYESRLINDWTSRVTADLSEGLKQTLLVAEEYEEEEDVRPQVVHVNLDPNLLLLLREIHYVRQEAFNLTLPSQARELVRSTDVTDLRVTASRLETIVSKYNSVMKGITEFELPLFERKLTKIDHLFDQGLNTLTWRTEEKADFIETATALVCSDLHSNLDILQTNCQEVAEITLSWSKGVLDIFAARQAVTSYPIHELITLQQSLNEELENLVMPSGNRIHALLQSSFKAVQMSSASPAWQDYVDYIDAIVLDGLKQACLTSLKTMLNQIVKANIGEEETVPILKVRLELIENQVAFRPPLDESTSSISVQETVSSWLTAFLARGQLVDMLGSKGSYTDYMAVDEEVQQLVEHIEKLVKDNAEECGTLYELFKDYAFLWQLDVKQTFEEFLQGKVSPNPIRNSAKISALTPSNLRLLASAKSNHSRASSAKSSIESAGIVGTAERSFLQPKQSQHSESSVPSLDEFDTEIDIFKTARDDIVSLQDYKDVGWLRVDLTPIKQVLITYSSKWMWTFTKYLSDQVSDMLEKLDTFLKRIEPEIEGISGEERDTASFMKMMRLFNEVSAQQSEMDGKFAAMHRTVLLVKKYGQQLPEATQNLFDAAPARWSSLKTKVSLAKQRLGPRIQEESKRITKDLEAFGERVKQLQKELESSEVYSRECSLGESWVLIDSFFTRLEVLENEAQDLIELQDLLETSVVNFSILPQCHQDLTNLKSVWETVRIIDERQSEWKRHRWQKMNTKVLRDETNRQMEVVRGLPDDIFTWDVYMGLLESITNIQDCLPLIEDLSNPAMRTRHWKQLVRVTGGAVQVDNDTLKRMTLGELLSLGLQKHVDDVRAIVQRAGKDLSIEQSLKTYEEVWLSKVFESREHTRQQPMSTSNSGEPDNQSEMSESVVVPPPASSRTPMRAASRISNQSSVGRARRASVCSLPVSLLNLGQDSGALTLLTNTEPIFDELENHQVALQAMQSSSAAGSFLDEVIKWQKRLQTVEAVLTTWLEVQEKWVELEEVFMSQDIRMALAQDANIFSAVNRDFRLLMRATEKNPNVLQCCQRKNILLILEKMDYDLEHCRRSLLVYLERRRQIFPRFYFLSMEDVLHIVCNGYDVDQLNVYIGKLVENVGHLAYEDIDDGETGHFTILGVNCRMGERLPFKQSMVAEGQVESWLTSLLHAIKAALQYQVATATGLEKPRPPREIHSAGARRVSISDRKSTNKSSRDKAGSRAGSRVGSRGSNHRSASAMFTVQGTPADISDNGPRSWILHHVTEVVYLVSQIQLTADIEGALSEVDGGKLTALEDCKNAVTGQIMSATSMLRGLEGDKDNVYKQMESARNSQLDRSHSGTEVGSQVGPTTQSKHGSYVDLDNQTIPEEGGPPRNDQDTAMSGPAPDTMTLSAMPAIPRDSGVTQGGADDNNDDNNDDSEEQVTMTYRKLQLYPSQIHKLSTLIALLAHHRDLVGRLEERRSSGAGGKLVTCFDWCSQLQYSIENETRLVSIKCMDEVFEYGYEYLGSTQRKVITPLTERAFLTLTQAVRAHQAGLCMGPRGSTRLGTVQELGKAMGRPMYTFNCTKSLDSFALHDIFKGFAATGAWICLNNINHMVPGVLSVCTQLITALYEALRSAKANVHFPTEEVQLTQGGACFAVIDSGIKVKTNDPEKLLLYRSVVSLLPDELMSQFRTVSLITPDLQLTFEILLTSRGFHHAAELAHKTVLLFDMCSGLSGTNAPVMNLIDHQTYNSLSVSTGWSQQILQYVAVEAGAILDRTFASHAQQHDVLGGDVLGPGEDAGVSGQPGGGATVEEEEEAVILALHNTYMPRLLDRDASIFTTLIHDLWPEVDIPMLFGGHRQASDIDVAIKSRTESHISKTVSKPKSATEGRSYRDSLITPVMALDSGLGDRYLVEQEKQVVTDIHDAITLAIANLGLIPGTTFQARVSQLAELNTAHKTVIVAGPAACGKSETIKTFALAERERGKQMVIQSIFTKSVESEQLLGHWDSETKEWQAGLVPCALRKFCLQAPVPVTGDKPVMKVLLLDGELDESQFELMEAILHNNGSVVLGNNERIQMPDNLRFLWEVETLAFLTPAILANVGVLVMTSRDVGWQMQLAMWVERRREADRDVLKRLCEHYVETVVQYMEDRTRREITGAVKSNHASYKRVIWQSNESYVNTFIAIFDALTVQFTDLTEVELERYFNYALVWAFGGTLEVKYREHFSTWWKNVVTNIHIFPSDGTVFDYVVDTESHMLVKWTELLPSYTGTPHVGIPPDAFLHSLYSEQLLYLLGVLTDAGKPVMLVGERGCGKSSIVNERIRTVCSGEVAEVLGLTINTNRFTNSNLLYKRLDDRLEWKHGRTFVPKGNKRLLCLIDDINLAQVDRYGMQTATELVRQHIDDGGFYDLQTHTWRYVKNVTYVTTINPRTTANVPNLNSRLLRHFAVFGCPYPNTSELHSIYSTLLYTHFITPELTSATAATSTSGTHHLGIMDETVRHVVKEEEEALKGVLSLIVSVTLELVDRLRTMYLPTANRCHYIFTMHDMSTIFRNLCLSLRPGCSRENLLLLWEHECEWVYGRRMVNEVDVTRYHQAFLTAVRKEFTNEDYIAVLSQSEKPIFTNLVEQDSGLVVAGQLLANNNNNGNISEEDAKTDLFHSTYNVSELRRLVDHGVEEYNKTHPRIKLDLYKVVLEQVCRLARVFASPHEVAHCALIAEGCPGRALLVANVAANLCGYSVFKINPSPIASPADYKMDTFKADLVTAYTKAGVKGEQLIFLLEEEELEEEDFLVFLAEFIVSGDITHLFSHEEMTTIINSIRTEVTQAGLTYTRDVAWNFFLSTVKRNFRVCVIMSGSGTDFQRRCRQYPSLIHNINFVCFPHWNKRQLIKHAAYHLKHVKWMEKMERENLAHLLSTMHIVLRQQDGQEAGCGQYRHITNTAYEKFIERFISMINARHSDIGENHSTMEAMNRQVQMENQLATRLRKQLEHEKVVLGERQAGTIRILSQIGQDTAITEQQIKIVKAQMEKITRLKKLLPEYQVAHERAVFKAIAIVADTKTLVQNMNIESLSELRAMQKPTIDIEDLMSAVIMILKTPQADLTWQKGAKRQMANLERFVEELLSFDDNVLPENTLALVEPYLKKASFDPDTLEKKTNISACGVLCRWVRGVCRYNRMMISKVKPLHKKVEETTQAIDGAEHRMVVLDNKRKALEVRLSDLAKGFEEATIDKNDQLEKTLKMDKSLETAGRLRRILRQEQSRIQQVLNSLPHRLAAIAGGVAMAAAFVTYLGPYHYNFRRLMLTVHWPNCLRERGVPLVIDSIHSTRGRVVDWAVDALKTASGASGTDIQDDYMDDDDDDEGGDSDDHDALVMEPDSEADAAVLGGDVETGTEKDDSQPENVNKDKEAEETSEERKEDSAREEEAEEQEEEDDYGDEEEEYSEGHSQPDGEESEDTTVTMPIISSDQYNRYMLSLIKLLVGDKTLMEWTKKDFGPRQIENAAILFSSWQRPVMLIDPYGEGQLSLQSLNPSMNRKSLVQLNMDTRSDPQVIMSIEKCIMKGQPVLLANCSEQLDTMVSPIIHHRNTALHNEAREEPRMIKYCGRRILCHQDFRLYMATSSPKPAFTSTVASSTTLLNYTTSNETLVDDLLIRAFARIRPELYTERRLGLKAVYTYKHVLGEIQEYSKQRIHPDNKNTPRREMFNENDVDMIADLTTKKRQMMEEVGTVENVLDELETLRDELFPIARRGTMLYAILRSLATLHPEYHFSLALFMQLFDEAIGGTFPPQFTEDSDYEEEYDDVSVATHDAPGGETTPASRRSPSDSPSPHSATQPPSLLTEETMEGTKTSDPPGEKGETEKAEIPSPEKEQTGGDVIDEASIIGVPDIPRLPSDGVDYTSLADNQIRQQVDKLTSLVYHRVKQSLLEEHRLLFATLLCLNIQEESGEYFSEEEISLLLQGVPGVDLHLTLADFECDESPPSWLPTDKWNDVMALSVMPGPLDGLCIHMASNSDEWKSWYRSICPEQEPLPIGGARGGSEEEENKASEKNRSEASKEGEGEEEEVSVADISEFHRLLLLRMLRPDRLPLAMRQYVSKHLNLGEEGEEGCHLKLDHLTQQAHHQAALVLLPPKPRDGQTSTHTTLHGHLTTIQHIKNIAQKLEVAVETLVLGEGREGAIHDALDTAERNNSWVIIDKIHLGSSKFLTDLRLQLQRIHKSRGEEDDGKAHFMAWLIAPAWEKLPLKLIHVLYTVSWDTLSQLTDGAVSPSPAAVTPPSPAVTPAILNQQDSHFHHLISQTISSSLKSLPVTSWQRVGAGHIKLAMYGLCVVHGLVTARQMLGTRGMSQFYPLSQAQLEDMLQLLLSRCFSEVTDEALVEQAVQAITHAVYSQLMCSLWDCRYVESLVQHVVPAMISSKQDNITVGSLTIPIPPANVEPADLGRWFEEKMPDLAVLKGLNLYNNVERTVNSAIASDFLRCLETLYEAQNMDLGDINAVDDKAVNLIRLRAILDSLLEQLPPLLELGHVPENVVNYDYDFPYHRPSVISVASKDSLLMPETIGFVLLQECMWLNSLLCHIRQNIYDIHQCLLAGPEAFPHDLRSIIYSLDAEHVPASWLHPNTQPSTHCLTSWQLHLKKRYAQMHVWVKQGMVPIFRDGHETPVSHGSLRSIWLGGLVNPGALFTALCQEKAVLGNKLKDEVTLAADVSRSYNDDSYDIVDEGGLYVRGLKIEGAMWDLKKNTLKEANQSTDINTLPSIYVRPVLISDTKSQHDPSPRSQHEKGGEEGVGEGEEEKKEEEREGKQYDRCQYDCPVFMNRARQMCAFTLPLASEGSADRWVRAGTAIILDSGVAEDASKKSRSYVAPKAVPLTSRVNDSLSSSRSLVNSQTLKPPDESGSDAGTSKLSQLSYKVMTPKASPLPAELTMIRESHVSRTSYADKMSLSMKSQPGAREVPNSGRSQQSLAKRDSPSNSLAMSAREAKSSPRNGAKGGSQVASRSGSQANSRAGSQANSRSGSQANSRAGSQANSRAGSQANSRAGSQTGSKPGTPRSLTAQRRVATNGTENDTSQKS